MVLTKAQAIAVFKQIGVAYTTDAVEELCVAMKNINDPEVADKTVKASFDIAARAGRKTVTSQDIKKIAAELQSKPATRGRLR
jgi:histone H3/H4